RSVVRGPVIPPVRIGRPPPESRTDEEPAVDVTAVPATTAVPTAAAAGTAAPPTPGPAPGVARDSRSGEERDRQDTDPGCPSHTGTISPFARPPLPRGRGRGRRRRWRRRGRS